MLRNAIESLAENYDMPLDESEELKVYKEIVENNLNDPELYNIINEQFRPTVIKVGTAGAYLWGCNQNYYGDVSKSCSALCNGCIGYNNENICQYQVWTYDEVLKSRGEVSNSSAYIYVSENWKGFKKYDIETLKKSKVEFVTVLKTENSIHKIVIPITSINNLPFVEECLAEKVEEKSYKIYYLFFVLLFLIITLHIFINFNNYKF